jgi:competence protein ComEA
MERSFRKRLVLSVYRLEQRLGITSAEFKTIAILALLYFVGSLVQHVRQSQLQHGIDYAPVFAAFDSARARASNSSPDTLVGPVFERWRAYSASVEVIDESRPEAPAASAGLVDLNTADVIELQTLPRIGPRLAERIIRFRDRRGGFDSIDELVRVSGIGAKTLETIRPHVIVGATSR